LKRSTQFPASAATRTGADIPVGETIAWIVAPGEQVPVESAASAPAARTGLHAKSEATPAAPVAASVSSPTSASSVKISPKARRLAKESGVDIATVRGTGPGGEILASDVQAAAAAPASARTEKSRKIDAPTSVGRIMAERTTQSWTTVPHFFVSRDLDAATLNEYRAGIVVEIERSHQIRIRHTDLLVAVAARVLLRHPRMNASWSTEGIHLHDQVNMGVVIAVKDGVVAAVIHDAHAASLAEIAHERHDLAERARAGKLRPSDIADATFSISNLGMYQMDWFSAIITPPQAAILAIGSIVDRVVAVEGKPTVRPVLTLTLSCDHRVADGAHAAQFLSDLAEAIHDPQKFLPRKRNMWGAAN
jgi:pyruvate dehydrogenase E2 component (dihydrolipoamide acetyltransferase)